MSWNVRRHAKIEMKLPGGLGNQLFAYFAARYYSDLLSIPLQLRLTRANVKYLRNFDRSDLHPLGDIRDFGLPGTFTFSRDNRQSRLVSRFLGRIPNVLLSTCQVIKGTNKIHQKGIYRSEEVSKSVSSLFSRYPKKSIELSGYFQNCDYALHFIRKEKKILRKNQVLDDFLESSRILDNHPIFIHLRLKDYLENSEMFGVLSLDYFQRCLELIDLTEPPMIWVFTDDPNKASELLSEFKYDFNFIEERLPIFLRDQTSVLQLMSRGKVLICSNSTYSVMAGLMSDEECSVFYPSPMFKDSSLAIVNIPQYWHAVPPTWLSVASKEIHES